MRRKEVRLVEVETDAAIERRPAAMHAGGACSAEEVHMVEFRVDARLLLSTVTDAEIQPLVFAFGHGDFRVHDGTLLLRIDRFDVDELEQLHRVEAALRFLDNTAAVEVALLEGELPLDDAITHARVADELHLPEVRQCI